MSEILRQLRDLVSRGEVVVSEHGYDELAEDNFLARDVIAGLVDAVVVEEYPDYHKGPRVLLFQKGPSGDAVHVVWGIPRGAASPAVLVTAYRPDPSRWSDEFTRKK